MNKITFKALLRNLDKIESYNVDIDSLYEILKCLNIERNYNISDPNLKLFINILIEYKLVSIYSNNFDLNPSLTIYAKSYDGSICETVSFIEYLIRFDRSRLDINNRSINLHGIDKILLTNIKSLKHCSLINNKLIYNNELSKYIEFISNTYHKSLISSVSLSLFIKDIFDNMKYFKTKNEDKDKILTSNKDMILDIYPKLGVPVSRANTKGIQHFFKDTLVNEFENKCAICNMRLNYFLIASHIKPFRDCNHIYEASDYNNGILLCKNHDFLFDQGYISIDTDGKLMIGHELLSLPNYANSLYLNEDFKLDKKYLSEDRIKYLQYHHDKIFRK